MQHPVYLAFLLFLIPLTTLAGVISTSPIDLKSIENAVPNHVSQCKWTVLVRADDLRVGALSYGDARLINNLTQINNTDDCEIIRWSLVLRSRENAAIRYPMPLIELPKEPNYNFTWDTYRHRISDFLDGRSSLNDEFGLSNFDPYKEEREEYDRKLEEYAKAIRARDHFVVQKIEKTHFEISLDMGKVENPIEDYQMTPVEPFSVSLPSSMKGPFNFDVQRQTIIDRKSNESKANLTYLQDSQLTYFVKLTLRNGTEVEIRAGDASFIPSKPTLSALLPKKINVNEKSGTVWSATRGMFLSNDNKDGNKYETNLPGLDATIRFDQIPYLSQGDQLKIDGTIATVSSSYEIVSIAAKLENRIEPRWALDMLMYDKRPELYEELKKRSAYPKDEGSRWFFNDDRSRLSVSIPRTAVSIFEKEKERMEKNEHDPRCDTSCSYSCTGTLGSDMKGVSRIKNDGSFSVWLNVSDSAAITPMDTEISQITSRLSFVLGIRLKDEDDGDGEVVHESNKRAEYVREALSDWPSQRHTMFRRCPEVSDEKKQKSATFFFKQPIGEVSISPKEWQKYDRMAHVEERHCIPEEIYENDLGPKLIRANDFDDQESSIHFQQACQSDPSAFPNLSSISNTIKKSSLPSNDQNVESVDSHEFRYGKSNMFKACSINNWMDPKNRFRPPSTCFFNTGEVWAKKLLEMYTLHQSSFEQETHPANQDVPEPILQFQQSMP